MRCGVDHLNTTDHETIHHAIRRLKLSLKPYLEMSMNQGKRLWVKCTLQKEPSLANVVVTVRLTPNRASAEAL